MPSIASRSSPPESLWQPDALIRTKLYLPQVRPNLVHRPALLARLAESLQRRLTLVSAPAGFGKTTLLAEWIAGCATPAAWVSLDARDNDPLRFGAYLAAALQTLELGLGDVAPTGAALRGANAQAPLETLLVGLINAAADVADDFVLVLDDFHLITAAPIHAAVAFLLEHLPPQMHLIVASRSDPPLALAQLRARGQLVELRAADLRFSLDEVQAFLRETMGLDLPPEATAALDARSEGWVASLQLAALALRNSRAASTPDAWPELVGAFSGTHRYVVDYLAEQVLLQQPAHIQDFLLETSILERLSAPLCDAVLGRGEGEATTGVTRAACLQFHGGSQAMLEQLDQANLFLSPLDDRRQWYRYHPLFADCLQARLRATRPERWRRLHLRAADWFRQNQLMEDAVRHAQAAPDYDLATELIEQVAETLWARSQIRLMLSWVKAMPEALVRSQPRLCVQLAWALGINGHLDEVEPWLQAAERALAGTPPAQAPSWAQSPQRLRVDIDLLRAFVARFCGQPQTALGLSQQALAHIPPEQTWTRAVALTMAGHACLLLGQTEAASEALEQARAASLATHHVAALLSATNYLAMLRVFQGRLRVAETLYREALQQVDDEAGFSLSGIERIGLGTVLREQNQLEAAAALVEAGLQRAEAGGDFTFVRDGYIARARLDQARGDWDSALSYAARAEQVARRSSLNRDVELMAAWRARLLLARGDVAAAAEWAEASGLSPGDPPDFGREYRHLTLARVLLAQGRLDEAQSLLQRLVDAAEAAGRLGRVTEGLALLALVLQARGERAPAQAALRRALALAEPEGFVRVFVDEGAPMAQLLARLRHGAGPLAPYVTRLLRAFGDAAEPSTFSATAPGSEAPTPGARDEQRQRRTRAEPSEPLAARRGRSPAKQPTLSAGLLDPLSERELSVLRLIAAGLSNQDIASELIVAQSTIHWHIKNIYSKLNVHSRTQAAVIARELGLVA